jgi:HEAT repeat protein
MDASLIIITYSLGFLFSFSLALFLYLILRRMVVQHQEALFQERYQKIESEVLKLITLPQENLALEIARKYKNHPQVLTRVLFDYIGQIKGEAKDQLKRIFDHALKEKCLKDIYSRRLVRRLKTTHLFVVFSGNSEAPHILKLLNDKPIVKLVAINALSHIPSFRTLSFIFQAFENDSVSSARTYLNIMYGLGDKIEGQVKKYLRKPLSEEKLELLIELIGSIPLRSLYQDILFFVDHPEKEIRIKVARALGHMRIPASLDVLFKLADDETWEVSAQAMKSLGKLGDAQAKEVLSEGLYSPFWHIRFNAGYGLAKLGETGIKCLQKVKEQKKDRYASEMAAMVLNETIYSGEA